MTGEKTASASDAAPYGSQRRNQRRDRESSSMKMNIDSPRSPIVYFDSSPSPKHRPARHHASLRPPIKARSRKYSAAAHAAVSGASGVMSIPARKKNGNVCAKSTA